MVDLKESYDLIEKLLDNDAELQKISKEVMTAIDANGDKQLELHEMEEFIEKACGKYGLKRKPGKDMVKKIFDEIDTDKSKTITEDEMHKFIRKLLEQIKASIADHMK